MFWVEKKLFVEHFVSGESIDSGLVSFVAPSPNKKYS